MSSEQIKDLRAEYGKQLVEEGKINNQIIVLDGDLKESTQSIQFEAAFPDRYLSMGIAEQNMVGVAAGLARSGKIPVVHSFAAFISMRACEQVRTDIAFQKLNVKLVVSHAGVSAGSAGSTHHTIEDLAIMRSMPNMTVFCPGDATDVKNCFKEAMKINGPVYFRLSAVNVPDIINPLDNYVLGDPYIISKGYDLSIFTTGITLSIADKVAKLLSKNTNLTVNLMHFPSVKPLNEKVIEEIARKTKVIYTIEEHNIIGGFGSAISEIVATYGGCRVIRLGINDHYCMPASQKYIFEKEGLSPKGIVNKILKTR